MDALQELLKRKPEVSAVYFNEAGEYQLFPRPGYDRKVDRDEVLEMKSGALEKQGSTGSGKAGIIADMSASGLAKDALLKHSEDVLSFEKEKEAFEADKNAHLQEKEAIEADRIALQQERDELTGLKIQYTDQSEEIKDLKEKIAAFEAAKNKK